MGVGKLICFLAGTLAGVGVTSGGKVLLEVGDEAEVKDPVDLPLDVVGDGVLGKDMVVEASTSIPSSTLNVVLVHRPRMESP